MDARLQEEIRSEAAKSRISEAMAWHIVMTREMLAGRISPLSAESYDPSQPRDEAGKWTAVGGGGGAAHDDTEKIRRNAAIRSWATQHGETGARELAGIERLVHKKGLSLTEASNQVYAKRARRIRSALGAHLYDTLKSDGKIKEGPPR